MILVDTCVWSSALRYNQSISSKSTELLGTAITEDFACLIGPIRQEVLSGIKQEVQYRKLRDYLRYFEDIPLVQEDFEQAAHYFNQGRNIGIQGSHTDFLICAVALRNKIPILTEDKDFLHYQTYLHNLSLILP